MKSKQDSTVCPYSLMRLPSGGMGCVYPPVWRIEWSAFHVHDKNAGAVHTFTTQHILPQRFRLSYVKDNSGHFPINRLRNVAINNTITSHFWLTDVDIWPACCSHSLFSLVADLYETILSLPSSLLAIDKQAIVVPVYEVLSTSKPPKASNKERVQNGNDDCTDLQACLFKCVKCESET